MCLCFKLLPMNASSLIVCSILTSYTCVSLHLCVPSLLVSSSLISLGACSQWGGLLSAPVFLFSMSIHLCAEPVYLAGWKALIENREVKIKLGALWRIQSCFSSDLVTSSQLSASSTETGFIHVLLESYKICILCICIFMLCKLSPWGCVCCVMSALWQTGNLSRVYPRLDISTVNLDWLHPFHKVKITLFGCLDNDLWTPKSNQVISCAKFKGTSLSSHIRQAYHALWCHRDLDICPLAAKM